MYGINKKCGRFWKKILMNHNLNLIISKYLPVNYPMII